MNIIPEFSPEELDFEDVKAKGRKRRRQNILHKVRDRFHAKSPVHRYAFLRDNELAGKDEWWNYYMRRMEPDYTFELEPTHTETGWGTAKAPRKFR